MTLIINQFLCLNRNLRFFVGIFDHFNHIYVDWRKQNRFIDYLFVNEACYLMAICFCQTNGKNNERGLDWFTKLLSTTLCNVDRVYQVFWSLLTEQCKMINEKKNILTSRSYLVLAVIDWNIFLLNPICQMYLRNQLG
jgi:hypothetical protein